MSEPSSVPPPSDITDGERLIEEPRLPGDPTDLCPLCGLPAGAELVLALGELQEVTKGGQANVRSEKGSYSYRYLELPDLLVEARRVLTAHHVAVMQEVTNVERDVTVVTVLLHASGREFRSPALTLRSDGTPQGIGSASTYARRYSLASYVGLAGDVDDDGQAARSRSQRQPPDTSSSGQAAVPPPRPAPDDRPAGKPQDHTRGSLAPGSASEQSIKLLWSLLRGTDMDEEHIRGWVAAVLQIPPDWSTKELSQWQVSTIIDRLKNEQAEAQEQTP